MKACIFIVSLVLIGLILPGQTCTQSSGVSQNPPTTKEELLQRLEHALKEKNRDAFFCLYYPKGILLGDDHKQTQNMVLDLILESQIRNVEFCPLPKDFKSDYFMNGIKYYPIPSIKGFIKVKHYNLGEKSKGSIQFPYGKLGGYFYIANTIQEVVDETAPKDKFLCIRIDGNCLPEPVKFKGEYICVRNKKDIHQLFEGESDLTKCFYGQHIKSCKVQKISQEGSIQLIISVDNKTIYESEKRETKQPIIYEPTISDN